MLKFAIDEASSKNWEVSEVVWVPGSMEAPLAIDRMLQSTEVQGAVVLGIIERGETAVSYTHLTLPTILRV